MDSETTAAAPTARRMNRSRPTTAQKPAGNATEQRPDAPAADKESNTTTEKPAPVTESTPATTATAATTPAATPNTEATTPTTGTATTTAKDATPSDPPATATAAAPQGAMSAAIAGLGVDGLSFTPAESVDLGHMKIMTLIYGDSGAGKTHFASLADDVVVALLDTQGFATIRSANPAAVVAGSPDKATQGQPRLQNMAQVRSFFAAVAAGKLAAAGVKTIVVDHITELQQMMIDEIVAEKRVKTAQPAVQGRTAGGQQAPPPQQVKGPAPEMTKQDWGTLATKMRNFLRMLRGLPHHIIVLALAAPSTDEATGRRMTFPALSGSAKDSLPSYFNLVGYIYKTQIDGVTQRVVMLDGDDRYYSKSYGPLKGIVQADVRLWQRLLAGEDGDVAAVGAKAPGGAQSSGKPRAGSTAPVADAGNESDAPANTY